MHHSTMYIDNNYHGMLGSDELYCADSIYPLFSTAYTEAYTRYVESHSIYFHTNDSFYYGYCEGILLQRYFFKWHHKMCEEATAYLRSGGVLQ